MRILTKQDIYFDKETFSYKDKQSEQAWKASKGVLKLLSKPTKEQQAKTNASKAVQAGRADHETMEHSTWGWMEDAELYTEVFLQSNDLFGKKCCSFADKLAIDASGTGKIGDVKFTSKPPSQRTFDANPLYAMQVACYTKLAAEMYELKMSMPTLLWICSTSKTLLKTETMEPASFAGWLRLAKGLIAG